MLKAELRCFCVACVNYVIAQINLELLKDRPPDELFSQQDIDTLKECLKNCTSEDKELITKKYMQLVDKLDTPAATGECWSDIISQVTSL